MKRIIFVITLFLIGCAQEEVMTTQPAIEAVPEQLPEATQEGPWEVVEVAEGVTVTQTPVEVKKEITDDVAKEIALARVPGRVTNVAMEQKFGKLAIVVEIQADNGPETDVIIDPDSGEVLGIET